MTADIVFDNIYVGSSSSAVSTAASLAEATYQLKKEKEEAASKAAKDGEDEDEVELPFPANIVHLIKEKVFGFLEIAKIDPVFALKTQPEVAVGLLVVVLTLFGISGTVLGVLGSSAAPKAKVRISPKSVVLKRMLKLKRCIGCSWKED